MASVPPDGIPYGKPSPGNKSNGITSPGGKQYHMVKFPLYGKSHPPHKFHDKGTNGEIVPAEIMPYGKPSPGRNPITELPQENNTIWQAFSPEEIPWQNFPLYGKSPPTQIPYVIFGTACAICGERGGGGEKSHRWGTFTIWYFIRGKEIHRGGGGNPTRHRIRLILTT